MRPLTEFKLTPEQQRFAEEHLATSIVRCADQAICLYCEMSCKTVRWIVDHRGRVLELTMFDRG